MSEPSTEVSTRCGFVALIGATNAGKSTLLNRLVGAKLSIVTHKVQTTRTIIRGIAIRGRTQIVFVDTPGIFRPRRRLDRAMVETAWGGARDADMVAVIVDAATAFTDADLSILERLSELRQPAILILNKIDRIEREKLLALVAEANAKATFTATFMISALNGDGCDDLLDHLAAALPAGPWLYPEDQISDAPLRQLAAEITREKLFLRLHQELPYALTVETEEWRELPNGSVRIAQTIFVERESQRKIVLGKGGQSIKAISMAARQEIAEIAEQPVHLFLFVKVRRNWTDDPERFREIGVDYSE